MTQLTRIIDKIYEGRTEEVHLFSNFEKYYREKDLVKASEFLWGSVSKITYLIGLLHGEKLGRHRELISFLRNLARSEDRPEVLEWINVAESLHSNFYHNWMEREVFEECVEKVVNLRMWLLKTLDEKLEEARP